MSATRTSRLADLVPSRETLAWGALLVNLEILLVLLYLVTNAHRITITRPVMLVLPFVWINVAIWAVVRTRPASSSRRQRLVAGGLAVGYLAVLAYVGGLVRPAVGGFTGIHPTWWTIPPGWGPHLFYDGAVIELSIVPYRVVGYGALAYLVYATALDASNALAGGLLGLFSCVSCTFPVVAAVLTGVAGGSGALAGAVYDHLYLASTVVFVVTVALLYWRPDPRRLWGS